MTASAAQICTPRSEERPLDQRALHTMMGAAAYHARRVARTMGLADIDREDVEQDILLALMERRRFFDPARGAWSSFADRIARQAAQVAADEIGAERRVSGGSLDEPVGDGENTVTLRGVVEAQLSTGLDPEEELRLPLALARFVAELPRDLALVAWLALREDGDLAEAQRQSALSTSEFTAACARFVTGSSAWASSARGSAPPRHLSNHLTTTTRPTDLLGKSTPSFAT